MDNNIFDEEKLHRFIKEAIQRIINENKVKEEHRALSAEELRKYGIVYADFKEFTADGIARALYHVYENIKQDGDNTSDFYCGITNDIVKRKEDHERDDYNGKAIDFVLTLQCKDMKTAADVEMIMRFRFGFCIGETETYANGAAEDSDFVYIYRIPK